MKRAKILLLLTLMTTLCLTLFLLTACRHEHVLKKHEALPATCYTPGNIEYWQCEKCDKLFLDEYAENEIVLENTVVAAHHTPQVMPAQLSTCEALGYTEGSKCGVCGLILVPQQILEKKEHSPITLAAKEASCTSTGLTEGVQCRVCKKILVEQEIINAKGHADTNHDCKCDTCKMQLPHDEQILSSKEASCTSTGLTEGIQCRVCKKILVEQEIISKIPHQFLDWNCSLCNQNVSTLAIESFDISENLNNSIMEYVIERPDGFYDIAIVGSGNMHNETVSTTPLLATGYATRVKTVTLDNDLTSIGSYAFYNCSALESIIIPENVTIMGESSFAGCSKLKTMTLPFTGYSLSATSPSKKTSLGYIFGEVNYSGAVSVSQPSHNTWRDVIYYIPSTLQSVTVLSGNILKSAFANCNMLTSIAIGETVSSIGQDAFANCKNLSEIIFVENSQCSSIGLDAFANTAYFNNERNWDGQVLYIGNHLITAQKSLRGDYCIKNGTKSIVENAFANCTVLTAITIPTTVKSINASAFLNCPLLLRIEIPENVSYIGSNAFYDCSSIETVTFAKNSQCKTIGKQAFGNCVLLKNITIPYNVVSIQLEAFIGCNALTNVYFEKTTGWQRFDGSGNNFKYLTSDEVADSITMASNLKSTYCSYNMYAPEK